VCVPCHSPDPAFDLPTASAVALVAGLYTFDTNGGSLRPPAPHARLARGCLSCHGTGAVRGVERGASHAFRVREDVCTDCHASDVAAPPELARRIAALRARFGDLPRSIVRPGAPSTRDARARWNAALLVNDDGAWAHAGPGSLAIADAALAE
jgi:hypothetical protein